MCQGKEEARQGNQYRRADSGDRAVMKGKTTDPTYSLADMIVEVLSY